MIEKGLEIIASNPRMLGEVLEQFGLMPNIEMSTMGGEVFWNNIASYRGWRVQKNSVFGNCRILDPSDIRKAWGGETAIREAFEYIVQNHAAEAASQDLGGSGVDPLERLERIGKLYDDGKLSKEEFEEKKKKFLDMI
jgi:hypothetical protein